MNYKMYIIGILFLIASMSVGGNAGWILWFIGFILILLSFDFNDRLENWRNKK